MKLWWHKKIKWEYWPVYVVYAPTFFYWLWLSLKFRSLSFYKWLNLGIENGGLFGDSKMKIYRLLPEHLYPKTILISKDIQPDFHGLLISYQLTFPLILKPDIGQRGRDVVKVNSLIELQHYFDKSKRDFLVQECIDLPREMGLFYYRFPGSDKGRISGVTIKNFLTIEGNGIKTARELLEENPRHALQIGKLEKLITLDEIIPAGERRCLVPFGNHNRGTEFLDGSHLITPQLERTINHILAPLEGFNFGRLDIRYNSIEELERGERFSIIEINGVKSEPTHIYDPKHSFLFGQKEIWRHQKIMVAIISKSRNAKKWLL